MQQTRHRGQVEDESIYVLLFYIYVFACGHYVLYYNAMKTKDGN